MTRRACWTSPGTPIPRTCLPHRLYLRNDSWRSLHPWLLYAEGGARERESLFCFNGIGRHPEYLDYASGETLRGKALNRILPEGDREIRAFFDMSPTSPPTTEPEHVGEGQFGDCQVIGKLGEGGMGEVHLARQLGLGRIVALKTLPAVHARNPLANARFQREILALGRCEHPNVVKILASGREGDRRYLLNGVR